MTTYELKIIITGEGQDAIDAMRQVASSAKGMKTATDAVATSLDGVTRAGGRTSLAIRGAGDSVEAAGKKARTAAEGPTWMKTSLDKLAEAGAAVGLAMGAVQVATAALDLGRHGADIELMASRFDNLARSVGTTSDALMVRLRDATSGMMSDAQLMSSASDIISLGLARDEDAIVRLATVISSLGWDMQQVILTFANNSTMRLDALGLSVSDVTERAKALEAQGYSTNDAFKFAVIEAGEAKLTLMGSAAETASGNMKRFDAAAANMADTIALKLTPAVTALMVGWTTILTMGDTQKNLMDDITQSVITTGGSYSDYIEKLVVFGTIYGTINDTQAESIRLYLANKGTLDELSASTVAATEEHLVFIASMTAGKEALNLLTDELGALTEEELAAANASASVAKAVGDLVRAAADGTDNMQVLADIGAYGMDTLSASIERTVMTQQQFSSQLGQLSLWMAGPLGNEMQNYADKQAALTARMEETRQKIIETQAADPTEENIAKVAELTGEYEKLGAEYDKNAAEHAAATNRIIYDLAKIALANSSLTFEQQLSALSTMADRLGLVDTATQEADIAMRSLIANTNASNAENLGRAMAVFSEEVQAGKSATDALESALFELNGRVVDVTVRVTEEYVSVGGWNGPPSLGGSGGGGGGGFQPDMMFAGGVNDFIVPPGYPNDMFRVGLTSGEHVSVTPAGSAHKPSGGDTFYVTITDQKAARMFLDSRRRAELERVRSVAHG